MENFKVQWDGPKGIRVTSVVSYGGSAAEDRKAALEAEGKTNVSVAAVPIFSQRSG
ncbi:hypothetical protein ABZZ36_41665 [Actinacidiphila glaucinigra]|uniref:hypothetical protein n=1 Tax=Actinacidiphila glaucinigra TaxID=235986 RepID=UPI0033BDFB60